MNGGETSAPSAPGAGALTPLATIDSYEDLHQALRQRREALNISFETLDRAGALTSGHSSKLLSPSKIKRATFATLDFLLPALGLKLALIEDAQALEQLNKFPTREVKVSARSLPWGRSGKQGVVSMRFIKRIARAGGEARARKLAPAQRSLIASQAARARWRRKVKR